MFAVVTGGAGFIGSHLVDALVAAGDELAVVDDCRTGDARYLDRHVRGGHIVHCRNDLLGDGWLHLLEDADRVYHLAADPDVRESAANPRSPFDNNVVATQRVLEGMRRYDVSEIVFTSTSTVYGEATVIPTPEDYAPLEPISVYGGSKLACEALISAYCHTYGMRAWVFRFANIVGPRSGHGVIPDFIARLRSDPGTLEILGDGRQIKSYMHVSDCVDGMLFAVEHADERFNVFNLGSEDWIDVRTIAGIVCEEMGLSDVKFRFTGGDRGWVGDVPRMQLSIERIARLGWRPRFGSAESVRRAARALLYGES
ncbi:MAG: NAD-dependent epimerase/dehydratase family protein [Methanoculleaceae archaeon]